ncbi:hypothetical protein SLA2020_304800 [Shorea laevis]
MSPAIPWNYPFSVIPPTSSEIEPSILAVETILNYSFRDKRLLEEALTHSSCSGSPSYQRLEFVGDAALSLALSNHIFLAYPDINQGQLSLLRAANVSTEKLARVAIRHGLYQYVIRKNATALDDKVREFAAIVRQEDNAVAYGGSVKAPKVLADIVESIAAAIYVDVNFDLQKLWMIFRGLLEPIVTLPNLLHQPQPVTLLFELCQKDGKKVDIKNWKSGAKNIASVYVDGVFVASSSSEQKEVAKLDAARLALDKLSKSLSAKTGVLDLSVEENGSLEIEGAKQKLNELCCKKKWPKPSYSVEKDGGPPHEKKYVCAVQVPTADGVLYMTGDEKSRVKDAENSAASFLIRALQESNYL